MTRKILLLITIIISQFSLGQDFQWVSKIDGNSSSLSIVCDNSNNIFSTGTFTDGADFDPNPTSIFSLNDTNIHGNGFVLKLDSNKNFQWVKQIAGPGHSIVLDHDQNIIITGLASGNQIDLDPDPINTFIVSNTNPDGSTGGFVIKLDPNGNFISGNFYSNYFAKESTIDTNNNIITIGNVGVSSSLNNKIFIIKRNSNNVFMWEKLISGNNIFPHSFACDNNDNIVLTGNFEFNMTFSNTSYTSGSYCDFIIKLNSNGQGIWYQKLSKTAGAGISNRDKAIKIDSSNNIYFITEYAGEPFSVNFNNQSVTLPYESGDEGALIKINENGNYIWSVVLFGIERQSLTSIDINTLGEIQIVSEITYLQPFIKDSNNITTQVPNLTNNSLRGLLILLDSNGGLINTKSICYGKLRVSTDNENSIYISSSFESLFDFDPSPTSTYNMFNSGYTGYIQKLGNCDTTIPSTSNDQTFCSSQNPTVTNLSPNSSSFNWYINATSSTELTSSTPLINGQTYYVSRQNGSCPESPRTPVTVTINQSPNAPTLNNQTFCENENANLDDIVITGQNIKWYSSNTALTDLPNNILLQNNTTYYATQTVNGCESLRTPILITITPNTLPTLTSPQTFCIQQNATINNIAITGQNIKWYDAVTNGNLLTNTTALVNGVTYYASQTINGCESNRVPVTIQIQNTSTPTGNVNQSFCSTENATVSDININGANIIWYNSASSTTPLANSTVLTNNTTYYATQTINGCESVNRLAVTISLINTLNATNYSEIICDDLNDNSEIINLTNYNSNLISSTGNTFNYYNSYNNALSQNSSGQITNFTAYNLILGTNTFYVRIDSPNTCFQIVTLTLELVSKPIIPINDIAPICEGSFITLNGGNNYDTYTWSTGETTQQITITQSGNYSVVVTENHGATTCTSTKNFSVVNSNIATIQEIISADWTDNNNTITVQLSSNSQGDYEYSLNGIHFQDSNSFNNLVAGEYTVFVRDKNGCGIVSEELYLLMYPKFFTPNGDGYNDYWKIKFSQNEPNLTIKIFDRYGKFIKQFGSNSIGWDGKYLGEDIPSSDYWFIVTRENGKEYKGHFSLKR